MTDKVVLLLHASTLAPFAACTVAYGFGSAWWRFPVGRVLMGLLLSIDAVLVLAIVVRGLAYQGPIVDFLRMAILGTVQVAAWAFFLKILQIQREPTVPDHPMRRSTDNQENQVTRDFMLDAVERAAKTFAQALLAYFAADAVDVVSADWGEALTIAATATLLSVLTSLLSLKLGHNGTASATDAVVPTAYADAIAKGRGASGLADGPR